MDRERLISEVRCFLRGERAQDLAEYCLLTALVALLSFAIFWQVSGGAKDIWSMTNSTLATGNAAASGTTPIGGAGSTPTKQESR